MPLISLEELSQELSVPKKFIEDLIEKQILTPYGGRARLGKPQFSRKTIPDIREKIGQFLPNYR